MKQKIPARMMAAAAGVALILSACSAPPALLKADGVERVSADRSAYPAELDQLRASARKLGAALLADGGDAGNGNVVSSPGSLLIALAMLRAGASGKTAAEMDSVLGLPAERRDEALNALLASLEAFDGDPGSVDEKNPPRKPVLHSSNGLFVDKGVPTGEGYLRSLARYYGTGVYPVDFLDEDTTKPAIDAWVNQNTGGRIKKAPAEYSKDNTLSLLNAVYFASAWDVPFDPADTSDLPFTTAAGGQVTVPTMSGVQDLAYAHGAGWQAVDLPYAEGFVMRLMLPDAGTTMPGPQSLVVAAFTHEIHFDRPFTYEIVHVETGLPLFMGRVSDPRPS